MTRTSIDGLAAALRQAGRVNDAVQALPAAVLWTDAHAQWRPVLTRIRQAGPGLLRLGNYRPTRVRGRRSD